MATIKVGIIGDGNVGSALARGLSLGHEVRTVGRDKAVIRTTVSWADIVLLAVPFGALDEVVAAAGESLAGKTVIDVTNALDAKMNLAVGFTTSGAEELQRKLPKAHVGFQHDLRAAHGYGPPRRSASDGLCGGRRRRCKGGRARVGSRDRIRRSGRRAAQKCAVARTIGVP